MIKLFLATLMVLTYVTGQAQTKNFIDLPYIEVSGSADTLITPNEIYIRVIISEKDTRDRVSLEDLELKMINALKALGIDTERDLTTFGMASNFKNYFLKGKDVVKTKNYELKVKDAVTAAKVFIKLEELGISNTTIARVDHSDLENIRNAMRANAIANAKVRALALTKPLNQNIGPAIYIGDVENYNSPEALQGRVAGIQIRGAAAISRYDDFYQVPENIDFEKIKVTANINVKFTLSGNQRQ